MKAKRNRASESGGTSEVEAASQLGKKLRPLIGADLRQLPDPSIVGRLGKEAADLIQGAEAPAEVLTAIAAGARRTPGEMLYRLCSFKHLAFSWELLERVEVSPGALLASGNWLCYVDPAARERLVYQRRDVAAGAPVATRGDANPGLFVLITGAVRMLLDDELYLSTCTSRFIHAFDPRSALAGKVVTTFVATEPSTLLLLPQPAVAGLMAEFPNFRVVQESWAEDFAKEERLAGKPSTGDDDEDDYE